MSYQSTFTAIARAYCANALNGEWMRIGRSQYRRVTGETVEKIRGGWSVVGSGYVYQSRYAAFSAVDHAHRS